MDGFSICMHDGWWLDVDKEMLDFDIKYVGSEVFVLYVKNIDWKLFDV